MAASTAVLRTVYVAIPFELAASSAVRAVHDLAEREGRVVVGRPSVRVHRSVDGLADALTFGIRSVVRATADTAIPLPSR